MSALTDSHNLTNIKTVRERFMNLIPEYHILTEDE
jgi:hypothetical protein